MRFCVSVDVGVGCSVFHSGSIITCVGVLVKGNVGSGTICFMYVLCSFQICGFD